LRGLLADWHQVSPSCLGQAVLAKNSSAGQKETVAHGIIEASNLISMPRRPDRLGALLRIAGSVFDWHRPCWREQPMKKIEATIPLSKLNEVQNALEELGIDGMTVCEVKGFGRQNRHKESYRSQEYVINFLPMIKIDLVVADQILEPTVKVFMHSAKTGSSGEGKVLISEVQEAAYAV
jgi:nitrogen regulatory protein P-II 1